MVTFSGLRELRERLLGFRPETVAELTGLGRARLEAIERGEAPSVYELERLADAYGVDPDILWDEPIVVPAGHGVQALASLEEFQELGDMTRARVVRAANAARDLVVLRRRLGVESGSLPALRAPDHRAEPYRQGADLAHQLRQKLGLGAAPIESMRDLVAAKLGAVAVLAADLGRASRLAGLGFADTTRGPTVVLNRFGKNENAAVRRVSLAHELCHLFADRTGEPLASISGYLSEKGLEREQRANSFAVRFLCPEAVVRGLRTVREEDAMRVLMDEYKLPYQATRLYLRNEASIVLPEAEPGKLPDPLLEGRETLPAVFDFPLAEVPLERRGVLAELAVRAWCRGLIPRDACARYLGVTPGHPIERVADFFDEEPTSESIAG
ncbi:MAG TPA: XRE family transcriptional regulator [Polyangiaceae bacterium]|nr:XRE family transcriptional regulator [Polyangiaceae bacterium]